MFETSCNMLPSVIKWSKTYLSSAAIWPMLQSSAFCKVWTVEIKHVSGFIAFKLVD